MLKQLQEQVVDTHQELENALHTIGQENISSQKMLNNNEKQSFTSDVIFFLTCGELSFIMLPRWVFRKLSSLLVSVLQKARGENLVFP